MIKKVLTIILILLMITIAICSKTYKGFTYVYDYFKEHKETSFINYDQEFTDNIFKKNNLIDLYGSINKALGIHDFYDSNIYVTKNNTIVSAYNQTSTDYEYYELIEFYDFLRNNNINMLYVNEPTKYINDEEFINEFSKDTYVNRNADLLLSRIKEYGIPTLDLREKINEEGLNIKDLFYRTDHHWKSNTGLWASKQIANALNEHCYYNIDTSIFNNDNFEFIEYKDHWLGEQGRKIGKSYVGLDDYTLIKPKFETSYVFIEDEGFVKGTFDYFIDEEAINNNEDVYDARSLNYVYKNTECMNNRVDYGKVLLISDSFQFSVYPFLSLDINHMDSLILRGQKDNFDLHEYILKNEYDTVIIAYAEFMIGSHDNISNSNYKMFTFNK